MPTSASFRRRAERRFPAGFSLLELLVVLALTSMTVALVVPRMAKTVEAISISGDRAEVQRQIQDLPLQARRRSQPIDLESQSDLAPMLDLPEGWKVSAATPFRVRENGICDAATLKVEGLGLVEEWSVAAPDCTTGHAE